MNSAEAIGGYFGLELRQGDFPYSHAVLLNTARNCFEYVLKAQGATHVYMPKYTCDVMMEPLEKLGIDYSWYEIDANLEIKNDINPGESEFIVYTNYFGIKDAYSRQIADVYGDRLILDCSQAFYFEPLKAGHTIYSPRKFFGLPDGGCLVTDKQLGEELPQDLSHDRLSHLLKRIDEGAEAGYDDFKKNDASLSGQPIKSMSKFTRRLLDNIDFAAAKQRRTANFELLHEQLKSTNKLSLSGVLPDGPMVYPYLIDNVGLRQRLIDNRIFVATYWPNVLEWCQDQEFEYSLAQRLLPLPIDQRYSDEDMRRIVEVIRQQA